MAVVFEQPERLALTRLTLSEPCADDVVVDICWSGISTGTERLLWTGRMPNFPGMGYPLVPGYESVGRIREAGANSGSKVGDLVFVPGARCFGDVRGLFGGSAQTVVIPGAKALVVDAALGADATLLALAATAHHALVAPHSRLPDLIVGHGVLGRLLARMTIALGGAAPTVWETNADRASGALGYPVLAPEADPRRDYQTICDVSGDARLLDTLIGRLAMGGEIVLAGFYSERLEFAFPPAFMREARIRVAAQWQPQDLLASKQLAESGALSLAGLITHRQPVLSADSAYRTAFGDSACLKMILDWSRKQ
nr:chlorophyll synthesis pathway protein BchC [Nevskia sp.]